MRLSEETEARLAEAAVALNSVDDERFSVLVDAVFEVLLEPGQSASLWQTLEEVGGSSGLETDVIKRAANDLIKYILDSLKKNLGAAHIEKELSASGLSERKSGVLSERYSSHHVRLCSRHLTHSNTNSLLDMEWKFGVTASSSELSTVGQTFLQLKMVIGDKSASETVHMELTLPEFYNFLHEMERAKASMELST